MLNLYRAGDYVYFSLHLNWLKGAAVFSGGAVPLGSGGSGDLIHVRANGNTTASPLSQRLLHFE